MITSRRTVFLFFISIIGLNFFSGCILNDIFGPNFTLNSYSVCDDDGFAGLSLSFSCSGTVTVKLVSPYDQLLDSDSFFYGEHNAIFHMSSHRETANSGWYKLYAYNKNDEEIFKKSISFDGVDIVIKECYQNWWKHNLLNDGFSFVGLNMIVGNNGDIPIYPYLCEVSMDSKMLSSFIFPCVILPNESKNVNCFIYMENTPMDNAFSVSLKDKDGSTLVIDSYSIFLEDNVSTKVYKWTYKNLKRIIKLPDLDYLFDYYSGIDRIRVEDYSLYVFDCYDDNYVDMLVDQILFIYDGESDIDLINFAASFVQSLEYKKDSEANAAVEYPRYPIETLFNGNGGGDCEDKSILTASILDKMGYNVALFRLPNHMAVGVQLDEEISYYDYYIDNYYFLETTNKGKPCGFIPSTYKSPSNLSVYTISSRPLLIHNWKNNTISIFEHSEMADFIKVTLVIENLGRDTANNFKVKAGFYSQTGFEYTETETILVLEPCQKMELSFSIDIPKNIETTFKTQIFLENVVVDERESLSTFP